MNIRQLSSAVAACYYLYSPVIQAETSPSSSPLPLPTALDRPALLSNKAQQGTLLAIASAGERLVAAGERGSILYSDDHGLKWTQASTPTSVTLTALRFVDAQRGWAVGHMGIVLHSTDGGKTWHKQLDGVQAARLAYAQAQRQGDEKALRQGELLLQDGPDKPFFDLYMEASGQGWIVGAYNLAFHTEDGGKTWEDWSSRLDNPKNLHLYGIARVGNILYIVGEQGLVLKGSANGQHFKEQASPYHGSWFGAIATGDSLLAYGLRGTVYRLSVAGEWQALPTATPASIAGAVQLADGRIVLASQSGQLLLGNGKDPFVPLPEKSPLPLTTLAQAANRNLVLASLRGLQTLPPPRQN